MVLKSYGIDVINLNFDTVIAASLCNRKRLGLKSLSEEILQHKDDKYRRINRNWKKSKNSLIK